MSPVTGIARTAVRMELDMWRSLGRWLARRPNVPAGGHPFRYTEPIMTVLMVFIVLSAVEIPIIDMIVHPWPAVRIPMLVLGFWGLTFMIGMLAGFRVNPHVVTDAALTVRSGPAVSVVVPWEQLDTLARSQRSYEKGASVQFDADDESVLCLPMGSETNLTATLAEPLLVTLPKGERVITAVRFRADDPDALLAAAREAVAAA